MNTSFSCSDKKSRCCTDPSLSLIFFHTSSVFLPFSSNNLTKNGFLIVHFVFAISLTYIFDQIGSMPCDTCPKINAEDVVGAIAFKVAFLLPTPFKTSGSPNISARCSEALYDFSFINLKTSVFKLYAS